MENVGTYRHVLEAKLEHILDSVAPILCVIFTTANRSHFLSIVIPILNRLAPDSFN